LLRCGDPCRFPFRICPAVRGHQRAGPFAPPGKCRRGGSRCLSVGRSRREKGSTDRVVVHEAPTPPPAFPEDEPRVSARVEAFRGCGFCRNEWRSRVRSAPLRAALRPGRQEGKRPVLHAAGGEVASSWTRRCRAG
jgi:hypothetical protein